MINIQITLKEKVEFAKSFSKLVEKINSFLSPIKSNFELAEVSYGYQMNNNVYYFDYPYPSIEKGEIVEAVNGATRGGLPKNALVNKDNYKNLDIEISDIFEQFQNKSNNYGYVWYEFIPNRDATPIITKIYSNIDNIDKNMLKKYFFVIYHCTNLDYEIEKIFNSEPELNENENENSQKEYLLYFNSKSIVDNEYPEVITSAFLSKKALTEDDLKFLCSKENIEFIYEGIIDTLRIHFNVSKMRYDSIHKAEQEKQEILSSYNILHPFKHRLSGLERTAIQVVKKFEKGLSVEKAKKLTIYTRDEVTKVRNFSWLAYLSYYSSFDSGLLEEIYTAYVSDDKKERRFSATDSLELSELIKTVFDTTEKSYKVKCELKMEQINFCIRPYFENKTKKYRLADLAYEAIFFELINNYANHCKIINKKAILDVRCEQLDNENVIVFSNLMKVEEDNTDWTILIPNKKAGGLTFVCDTLKNTQSGCLFQRIINGKYEVALALRGCYEHRK